MKKLKKARQAYEALKVSEKLSDTVKIAFKKEQEGPKQTNRILKIGRPILTTCFSFCFLFVILLNISPTFANAAYQIPGIREIAKICTIHDYEEQTETELIKVKIPALENTGNTDLEKRINQEISEKINFLIEESKASAKEIRTMIEEMKDPEVKFHPMEIGIDYEVKNSEEERVSFVLSKYETYSSTIEERFYYNLNLKTGENITLQELLGENYKETINEQIEKQIKERMEKDSNVMFFCEKDDILLEHGAGFNGIEENQDFYINKTGNIVIAFPKYSIAPGYMGVVEFEIIKE